MSTIETEQFTLAVILVSKGVSFKPSKSSIARTPFKPMDEAVSQSIKETEEPSLRNAKTFVFSREPLTFTGKFLRSGYESSHVDFELPLVELTEEAGYFDDFASEKCNKI